MPVSEAKRRAITKYDQKSVEKTTVRLKKGTRARIEATGAASINGFITDAIEEKLNREKPGK